jgi:hypothetical protein
VAWPLAARAQQGERARRIGVLLPASSDDAEFQVRVGAFLQGLGQMGWIIGRNLRIWRTLRSIRRLGQAPSRSCGRSLPSCR